MASDPRLERYLTALERALKPFPVSDRAEVITEIKSHVLAALEHDPQARLDHVLAALGEPEMVANRYLIDRGLKTAKPPISPIVKWLVVGFLTTIAMLFIFLGFLVSQFSPIIKVEEKGDKVAFLGGLIQVNGDEGKFKITGFGDGDRETLSGVSEVAKEQSLRVLFAKGNVELTNASDARFAWNCRAKKGQNPIPKNDKGEITLDLSSLGGVKCELAIPEKTLLIVNGRAGKIDVSDAKFNLDVQLDNGKVAFNPADETPYHYDLHVGVGKIADQDDFKSSAEPDALKIKIHVGNGKIIHSN